MNGITKAAKDIFYLYNLNKYRREFKRTENIKRILVIVDVNDNDFSAVQQSAKALRYYFSDSIIDYICNQPGDFTSSNIFDADNIYSVSYGNGIATNEEFEKLRKILSKNKYSLILNFSPYIEEGAFNKIANVLQLFIPFSKYTDYLRANGSGKNQVPAALHSFIHQFLNPVMMEKDYHNQVKKSPFTEYTKKVKLDILGI